LAREKEKLWKAQRVFFGKNEPKLPHYEKQNPKIHVLDKFGKKKHFSVLINKDLTLNNR
jgi:hypothetical protein